jgi:hypothetical protein
MTRITDGNRIGRNITGDHRPCSDGDIVANGDAWQDGDTTAYPHIVADGDGLCPFLTSIPLNGVGTVTSCVDADVGTKETIIADGDRRFIQDGEVEVGKKSPSDADLLAVVATKRLVDDEAIVAYMSQQALENRLHTKGLRRTKRIELI